MTRSIHPAEIGLFTAAALRGYRLEDGPDGTYRVIEVKEGIDRLIAENVRFKEVANLCGANGKVTLRQAADLDGLKFPATAQEWLEIVKKIS